MIVPVVAAPGGGGGATYTVYGYVKEAGTYTKIAGASVVLYKVTEYGRYKVASKTTNSNGYYSFSTYQSSMPMCWDVRVSKSGYESNFKVVLCRSTTTYMGSVYLTPAIAPPEPEITIISAEWRNSDFTLFWHVEWGTPLGGTTYTMKLYWSEDSVFDETELVQSWSGTSDPFKTKTIQATHRGDWWYKIKAVASNTYGDPEDVKILPTTGIILPIGDTYTDEYYPYDYFGFDSDLSAGTPFSSYDTRAYLKFEVPNPDDVSSVSLFAYKKNPGEHDGVAAYQVDNSWSETTLCWYNQPDYDPKFGLIDVDPFGKYDNWDCWDVTEIAKNPAGFAVVLIFKGDEIGLTDPVEYQSKDGDWQKGPHLLVQYAVYPEDTPDVTEGAAVTDEFDEDELDETVWTAFHHPLDDPPPLMTYACYDGALHTGGLNTTPPGLNWMFAQDVTYTSGFNFEVGVGIAHFNPFGLPETFRTGIQFFNEPIDTTCSTPSFCDLYLEYRKSIIPNWYDYWVCGRIGDEYEEVHVVSGPSMFALASLKIHQDPKTGVLILGYDVKYDDSQGELMRFSLPTSLRSFSLASSTYTLSGHLSEGIFDYFRDYPIQRGESLDIEDELGLNEPIRSWNFEEESDVRLDWNTGEIGEVSDFDDVEGGTSWHVGATETEGQYQWSMVQQLEDTDLFKLDSLKGHMIAFSVFARGDSTTSMVRVEIGYENEGESFDVCSEWQVLNEDDNFWIELSVSTMATIPETVSSVEVRIMGIGYKDSYFTGYVDFAELKLVTHDSSESKYGSLMMISSLYYSFVTSPSDGLVDLRFRPILVARANEGYQIRNIRFDIDLIETTSDIVENDASIHHLVEGNNIGADYTTPEEYEDWIQLLTLIRHYGKWGIRAATFLTSLIFGGIPAPIGWAIHEGFGSTMDFLMYMTRPVSKPDTGLEYHANGDINYDWTENVNCSLFGGRVLWNLDPFGHDTAPAMRVTFSVDWCSDLGWPVGTTSIGLCFVCLD